MINILYVQYTLGAYGNTPLLRGCGREWIKLNCILENAEYLAQVQSVLPLEIEPQKLH